MRSKPGWITAMVPRQGSIGNKGYRNPGGGAMKRCSCSCVDSLLHRVDKKLRWRSPLPEQAATWQG